MNSIRASLVAMLVAAFFLVSFLAALNGYRASMREAEHLLDSQLQYASEILMLQGGESHTGVAATRYGDRLAFQVWRDGELQLRSTTAPQEQINELAPGFHYANFAGYRWRTLTRESDDGSWYIVAERADLRHLLAEKVVLESVLPLLLWLPLSAILVWVLVGWGLRPLRDLSGEINSKRSDDLRAIQYENPPAELVQLIDSTNALLARLAASFEREKHFAAHAAHELRTPLSVLKVHLHNLAGELPAGHPGLAHANAGVERMHHLVEQILDLNRTNPEIIEAQFSQLDLHKMAQRVTASAWPAFEEREQTLSLQGDGVTLTGDEVLLETLLQNLLDNAGKYTPAGGEIEVFAGRVGEFARLQVCDSGPGIPDSERDRVFERFYRAAGEGDSEAIGSGLGLAIVQHIVQLHNAHIELGDSSLGGLSVTVDFPIEGEAG
jgi:two-component system sensor histidine kinase QseC